MAYRLPQGIHICNFVSAFPVALSAGHVYIRLLLEQSFHLSSGITWHFWMTAVVVSQVPCFVIPGAVSSSAYPPAPAYATKSSASMGG